jgi:hypothetical protein
MSAPSTKATARPLRLKVSPGQAVPAASLLPLLRDYANRRAQLEKRQSDTETSIAFRRASHLQAVVLTMVITDLEALLADEPGRFSHG